MILNYWNLLWMHKKKYLYSSTIRIPTSTHQCCDKENRLICCFMGRHTAWISGVCEIQRREEALAVAAMFSLFRCSRASLLLAGPDTKRAARRSPLPAPEPAASRAAAASNSHSSTRFSVALNQSANGLSVPEDAASKSKKYYGK